MLTPLKTLAVTVLSLWALASVTIATQAQSSAPASSFSDAGAAFAMTNETADNRIVTYRRATDGRLTLTGSVSTRGHGIGTDLDTQNGLQLSADHRFLYAVNAGSDDISVFAVRRSNLGFVQKVYAGDEPFSLTLSGDLLYVLNGSVAGNGIRGFRVAGNGTLTPLPNSFRALSSPIAVPGIVQFSANGRVLLVTHKVTDALVPPGRIIDAFRVMSDGYASPMPVPNESHGLRPFSLAVRADGKVVVVESFNASEGRTAASSYTLANDGTLSLISGSVRNAQTDGCWVVITRDGQYAFTANFGSGTISSYGLSLTGELRLIKGDAAFLGKNSQPVDLAFSSGSRYLYLLLRGAGAVAAFRVTSGGGLVSLGRVGGGLPVADGASGLAAY